MKQFEISGPIGKELSREEMTAAAAKALGVAPAKVAHCRVVRRSVDARNDIVYRYRIEAFAAGETYEEYRLEEYRDVSAAEPVIIVGAGPAGMFAALKLLTLGLKPVILERGRDVHARKKDMAALSVSGHVDPDSNYCFGEGGAGAFSDGKLDSDGSPSAYRKRQAAADSGEYPQVYRGAWRGVSFRSPCDGYCTER